MIESGATGKFSSVPLEKPSDRERPAQASNRNGKNEGASARQTNQDRFEPSNELAARETAQAEANAQAKAERRTRGEVGERPNLVPIEDASESSEIVNRTSRDIEADAAAAAAAQGGLNQDRVLDLIA